MSDLTARFKLIDEMSAKLQTISTNGQKMLDSIGQAGDSANTSFGTAEEAAGDFAESLDETARSIDELEDSLQDAGNSLDNYSDSIEQSSRYIYNMTENGLEIVDTMEDTADATTEAATAMKKLGEEADDTREETKGLGEETDKTKETGLEAIESVSSALASAGIAKVIQEVVSSLLEAASAAAELETAFAKLETISGSDSIGSLTDDIAALSSEMGIAQDELSDVVYNAISAGASVEDAVDTAEAAAKLATAGFTETSSALSVLSTAMNSYGDSAGTAAEISDSLIMVQNLGVTTVAELSSAMGKAIATASAYGVDLGNIESSYVSLTKSGIATAEATTYLSSMMNELGDTSSDISTIIEEETGESFASLMEDGYSLADVLGIVYESLDEDSTAMMNLWGSAEAGKAANAIINQGLEEFNSNLELITDSAGATEEAYATMADTTEYSQQRMTIAAENLQIAIGDDLNPVMNELYEIGANAFSWATDFVNDHPVVVKAIAAVGAGLITVAGGIAAVTAAASLAKVATLALGSSMTAVLGPLALVAAGVTAVTAAITILGGQYDEAYDEAQEFSAATDLQITELEDLQRQYDELVDAGEADTEAAYRLQYQIDDLTESIEENGRSVQDVVDDMMDLVESYEEVMSAYDDSIAEIDTQESATQTLITKLQDLSVAAGDSEEAQDAMKAILDEVNESLGDAGISYAEYITNVEGSTQALREAAQEQAEYLAKQEMYETYVELLAQQTLQQDELSKATEEVAAAQERASAAEDAYLDKYNEYTLNGINPLGGLSLMWSDEKAVVNAAYDELAAYDDALDELTATAEETDAQIEELAEALGIAVGETKEAEEATWSLESAIDVAYSGVEENLTELIELYEEAYDAAYSSFSGMFDLFDEAEADSDATVAASQEALDSQLAYWTEYNENLSAMMAVTDKQLEDWGTTREEFDQLIEYVSAGDETAAGLAASIVSNIESGNTEAVADMAGTLAEVSNQQATAAEMVATFETDFEDQMDEIVNTMEETIDALDLEDEAYDAAESTISGYIEGLLSLEDDAVLTAQEIADRISGALVITSSTTTTTTAEEAETGYASGTLHSVSRFVAGEEGPELIAAHAEGTLNGERFYMAGEEGPELIVGAEGSKVFPTSETDRLIDALNATESIYNATEEAYYTGDSYNYSTENQYAGDNAYNYSTENQYTGGDSYTYTNENYSNLYNSSSYVDNSLTSGDSYSYGDEKSYISNSYADYRTTTGDSLANDYNYTYITEGAPYIVTLDDDRETDERGSAESGTESERRIVIEIAGSGEISVGGGTDTNAVVEILQDQLRPVLMEILQEEIYEEGDGTYGY